MNHTCDKNESILNSLPINAPPMDKFGKITRVLDVENDFDTTILPNGVYICKIKTTSDTHTEKLIVTH